MRFVWVVVLLKFMPNRQIYNVHILNKIIYVGEPIRLQFVRATQNGNWGVFEFESNVLCKCVSECGKCECVLILCFRFTVRVGGWFGGVCVLCSSLNSGLSGTRAKGLSTRHTRKHRWENKYLKIILVSCWIAFNCRIKLWFILFVCEFNWPRLSSFPVSTSSEKEIRVEINNFLRQLRFRNIFNLLCVAYI